MLPLHFLFEFTLCHCAINNFCVTQLMQTECNERYAERVWNKNELQCYNWCHAIKAAKKIIRDANEWCWLLLLLFRHNTIIPMKIMIQGLCCDADNCLLLHSIFRLTRFLAPIAVERPTGPNHCTPFIFLSKSQYIETVASDVESNAVSWSNRWCDRFIKRFKYTRMHRT